MNEATIPEIRTILIDADGRYLMIVKGLDEAQAREMTFDLHKWWNSGQEIGVLWVSSEIEIHIERVGHSGLLARLLDKVRGGSNG